MDLRHCSTLTDAGLSALSALPALEELAASFCSQLTDAGVARLAQGAGPRLRRLDLYHVPLLTEAAVTAVLRHCPGLRELNLGRCAAIGALAGVGGFLVQGHHYLDA